MREYHGATNTKLYYVWSTMRGRCRNPTDQRWKHYGGRGITICAAWDSFIAFETWAIKNGYKPGLTIERQDNNGPYAPENCCFIPQTEQPRNRRNNIRLTAFGEEKILKDWSRDPRCQVKYVTLWTRIVKRNWSLETAMRR